jgi:diguanylate cyclase (GGDEF)-like protein/PAS domain S-box-containing protein
MEMNPALTAMLGYTPSELKRLDVKKLYFKKDERDHFLKRMERAPVTVGEFRLRTKAGRAIWVRDYCRAVMNRDGSIAYFDGILVDMTREKKAEDKVAKVLQQLRDSNAERQEMIKRLETYSVRDELTGLYNRRGFFMITKEYLNLAIRKKIRMYLLFIDMDDLKLTNDTYGHHVGDEALRQLSQILKTTFRSSDIKGRMGGDEFAVFPIDSSLDGVEVALARLQKAIDECNASSEKPFRLSISTGLAFFDPEFPTTIDDLLVRADKQMYERKRSKRGEC